MNGFITIKTLRTLVKQIIGVDETGFSYEKGDSKWHGEPTCYFCATFVSIKAGSFHAFLN